LRENAFETGEEGEGSSEKEWVSRANLMNALEKERENAASLEESLFISPSLSLSYSLSIFF